MHARSVGRFLVRLQEDRFPVRPVRCEDHPLAFVPTHLPRSEVRHQHHLATDEVLGGVLRSNPGALPVWGLRCVFGSSWAARARLLVVAAKTS